MMSSFNRFFILFLLATLAIFIQRGGFLNIYGIVPNLVMVFFISRIISGEGFSMIATVFLAVIASAFIVDPFWISEFSIMGAIILIVFGLRKRFTGNAITDLFIMTFLAELLFYGSIRLLNITSSFSVITVAFEFLYTILVGVPILVLSRRYFK
ncbi:MAG: hypothetical protein NTZ36_02645 [Candidatus Jorgensenbacteria bacterium]|nr:hypothetical protein [Candidatus Jorgensenbacteria bacterium]